MKLNAKQVKAITKVASTDSARPGLTNVLLSRDGATYVTGPALIATNGHALAAVPLTVEDGEAAVERDYLLNAKALAMNVAPHGKRNPDTHIAVNGVVKVWSKSDQFIEVESTRDNAGTYYAGPYPAVEQVNPLRVPGKRKTTVKIGLNPTLLLELATALGNAENVALDIETVDNAIVVRAANLRGDGVQPAVGLLMPIRVTSEGGA